MGDAHDGFNEEHGRYRFQYLFHIMGFNEGGWKENMTNVSLHTALCSPSR